MVEVVFVCVHWDVIILIVEVIYNMTDKECEQLIGNKINGLKLIKYLGKDKNGKPRYDCLCDCGDIRYDIDYYRIRSGEVKFCKKCMNNKAWDKYRKENAPNLIGLRVGMLTVIKRGDDIIDNKNRHTRTWWCLCDCQLSLPESERKLVLIREVCLTRDKPTQSCGCLQRIVVSSSFKKYNNFIKKDNYYIGFTSKNEPFYIDLEDYDKIKDYCWYINKDGYLATNDKRSSHRLLHRLIMNCPEDLEVDHIHGKPTRNDNRKYNLRLATRKENSRNIGLRSNNKSGIIGVSWCEDTNDWVAQIGVDLKTIVIGHFSNKEDAARARREAEEKYFGEWSYNNSINLTKYNNKQGEDNAKN